MPIFVSLRSVPSRPLSTGPCARPKRWAPAVTGRSLGSSPNACTPSVALAPPGASKSQPLLLRPCRAKPCQQARGSASGGDCTRACHLWIAAAHKTKKKNDDFESLSLAGGPHEKSCGMGEWSGGEGEQWFFLVAKENSQHCGYFDGIPCPRQPICFFPISHGQAAVDCETLRSNSCSREQCV